MTRALPGCYLYRGRGMIADPSDTVSNRVGHWSFPGKLSNGGSGALLGRAEQSPSL